MQLFDVVLGENPALSMVGQENMIDQTISNMFRMSWPLASLVLALAFCLNDFKRAFAEVMQVLGGLVHQQLGHVFFR